MHTTQLRKVGQAVVIEVPPELLTALDFRVGLTVAIGSEN